MARPHCVILGGGFGGVATAHRLRARLRGEVDITLIDRRDTFMMGLRILWTLVGHAGRAGGTRPLERLSRHSVRYVRDEVVEIDAGRRRVVTGSGTFESDALVIALGADLRPDLVPGYDPRGSNLCDPDQAERIAARLAAIDRGRVGISIFGTPYKCPPAPYEAAFLIDGMLRRRGVRDRIEMEISTPTPVSLPVAGPEMCRMVEELLAARDIRFLPKRKVLGVEGAEIVFDGERRAYDLLIAISPHAAPAVVKSAGLTAGEWIRPDPRTCEVPGHPGVFAVGDVTEMPLHAGMALPKAGIFAEAQGIVAAEVIASRFDGGPAPEFDGWGTCFVETGDGKAAAVRGQFFATPAPAISVDAPGEFTLQEKRDFESSRLSAWF